MNYAFTIKVVSFSLIHKRSIILFENSPRITIYFAMDLLSFLRFLELFRFIALNSPHVFHLMFHKSTMNSLFILRSCFEFTISFKIYYEFTLYFAYSLLIHCPYRESNENSRGVSRILFELMFRE